MRASSLQARAALRAPASRGRTSTPDLQGRLKHAALSVLTRPRPPLAPRPGLHTAGPAGGYHCIVLDPPWENASARRSGRYPTLPSRNLLGLPVRALAARQGCLVAMWVTNRERHRRFIDQGARCCDGGRDGLLAAGGRSRWHGLGPRRVARGVQAQLRQACSAAWTALASLSLPPSPPSLPCPARAAAGVGPEAPGHLALAEGHRRGPAGQPPGEARPLVLLLLLLVMMVVVQSCAGGVSVAPAAAATRSGWAARLRSARRGSCASQRSLRTRSTTMQDVEHRRPYESLLLCWPTHLPPPAGMDPEPEAAAAGSGFRLLRGRPLVLVAVPPAAHSRKPHLGPLLLPLLPPGARCLEVRAGWRVCCWSGLGTGCTCLSEVSPRTPRPAPVCPHSPASSSACSPRPSARTHPPTHLDPALARRCSRASCTPAGRRGATRRCTSRPSPSL